MRRILYALFTTLSALVLLFSYHTSTEPQAAARPVGVVTPAGTAVQAQAAATTSGGGNGAGGSGSRKRSTSDSTGTATTSAATGAGTYSGTAYSTPWGPVQVQITVSDGRITAAEATQYPNNDHHSSRINADAVPMLNTQAVTAQSAELDGVSGATFTTTAYAQSLQSAIDAAGL